MDFFTRTSTPAQVDGDCDDVWQRDAQHNSDSGIQKLPQELLDTIIEHLQGHKRSLAACTLVGRNWHYTARKYLMHTVYVLVTRLERDFDSFFSFICKAPTSVTGNIRTLYFWKDIYPYHPDSAAVLSIHDVAAAICYMPSLHTLSSSNVVLINREFPEPITQNQESLARALTVKRLTLNIEVDLYLPLLQDSLRMYPAVTELALLPSCVPTIVRMDERYQEPILPPVQLRNVELGSFNSTVDRSPYKLLCVLHETDGVLSSLTRLHCRYIWYFELPFLRHILERCGASLTHLRIHPRYGPSSVDTKIGLSLCPSVIWLRLDFAVPDCAAELLSYVLSDVFAAPRGASSPLVLHLGIYQQKPRYLEGCDAVLSSYTSQQIRKVKFSMIRLTSMRKGYGDGRPLKEFERNVVRRMMPEAWERGLLAFD